MLVLIQRILSFSFLTFFLYSCASKVMPEGGAKDTQAPKVLYSEPKNFSTLYFGSKIEIHFDEYIQLADAEKNIIVTPLSDSLPEIKVKNKSINIIFPKENKSNTTYTINFGKSIKDLNEGNVLDNFRYVFSTGAFLDSLKIQFRVKEIESGLAAKDFLVMAFKSNEDSVLFKYKPDYYSRTNDQGEAVIENMASGSYQIFALKDENNNYRYDNEKEHIAFYPQRLDLPFDQVIQFKSYQPEWPSYIKSSAAVGFGKSLIILNKAHHSAKVSFFDSVVYAYRWNARLDSLEFWYNAPVNDYVSFNLLLNDETNLTDSVFIASKQKTTADKVLVIPALFQSGLYYQDSLLLKLSTPAISINKDSIELHSSDSVPLSIEIILQDSHRLLIVHQWMKDSMYQLKLFPGAIKTIDGRSNSDTLVYNFNILNDDVWGNLELRFKAPDLAIPYILELYSEQGALVTKKIASAEERITFIHLNPGVYKLRCIADMNSNQKWDQGDLRNLSPAENIIHYESPLNIRANWDLELEWEIKDFE
ncbi:MAG TPA: Ig-like domain-containing protein [Bacteroidia bacterium]|nr:Ig-like domain-containing protein [Bacteroidia bacterium]